MADMKKHVQAFVDGATASPSTNLIRMEMPPFKSITVDDLLVAILKPRGTVLAPWLPEKGLAMIYGQRGTGKTLLTMACAYAIASGGEVMGWSAHTPMKVLIVDGEMPVHVLQERMKKLVGGASKQLPAPEYLRFLAMDTQERDLDLADDAHQIELEDIIGDAEVIIVDNISTLTRGGKENEAESWLPVQQWALKQRRAGRSVVFIHHAGKGGQQRGTSRREDVLDTVISLQRPKDYTAGQGARFQVHFDKNRGFFGDEAKPFEAILKDGDWSARDVSDAEAERVIALSSESYSVRDIAHELGITSSRVNRIQKKARENGQLLTAPQKAGRKPRSPEPLDPLINAPNSDLTKHQT